MYEKKLSEREATTIVVVFNMPKVYRNTRAMLFIIFFWFNTIYHFIHDRWTDSFVYRAALTERASNVVKVAFHNPLMRVSLWTEIDGSSDSHTLLKSRPIPIINHLLDEPSIFKPAMQMIWFLNMSPRNK